MDTKKIANFHLCIMYLNFFLIKWSVTDLFPEKRVFALGYIPRLLLLQYRLDCKDMGQDFPKILHKFIWEGSDS